MNSLYMAVASVISVLHRRRFRPIQQLV